VEVQAVDDYSYAIRQYGVTREELERFDQALDEKIAREGKQGGYLKFASAAALKEALEKAPPG
jgi:hypothetical protein